MTKPRFVLLAVALLGFVFIGVVDPRLAGQVLYCTMAILAFTFTMLYGTRSNWRETAAGRALMYVVGMFAFLSAWLSVSFWLGDRLSGEKDIVRGFLLVALIVMLVNLIITLYRIQQNTTPEDRRMARAASRFTAALNRFQEESEAKERKIDQERDRSDK